MAATDLKDIKDYWMKKYPNIDITLYSNEDESKFFGNMRGVQENIRLSADTIGELISQGEAFLRRVK